jgi:hypothetical protein
MLEISARWTGKTERLIKAAYTFPIGSAIIVCASNGRVTNLKQKCSGMGGLGIIHYSHLLKWWEREEDFVFFFDDFDEYLDDIPELRKTDYFATAPMKLRVLPDQADDRLFTLIELHGGQFTSIVNFYKPLLLKMSKTLPYDAFRREVLGQFCEPYPLNI